MTYKASILATGGAGFIGSHTCVELLQAGYRVVVLDNFENSDRNVPARMSSLAGGDLRLVEGDVRNARLVADVLTAHGVTAVLHFAGKKAVGESVSDPLLYFHDNILGAVALLSGMRAAGVRKLVFSSSATVYGAPDQMPIPETTPVTAANPYGRTKLMIEEIIDDVCRADPAFRAISLRYFNPVGAHPSAQIGEDPRGVPNNLFPYVAQTAAGQRDCVQVFGNDYPTQDGTGIRDYVHVVDLARGHLAALDYLFDAGAKAQPHGRINLGTGRGHTVLEVIRAFSEAAGHDIPYRIVARRPGDAAASVADPGLATRLLGWSPRFDLTDMCRDHWRFQSGRTARPLEIAATEPFRKGIVLNMVTGLGAAAMRQGSATS